MNLSVCNSVSLPAPWQSSPFIHLHSDPVACSVLSQIHCCHLYSPLASLSSGRPLDTGLTVTLSRFNSLKIVKRQIWEKSETETTNTEREQTSPGEVPAAAAAAAGLKQVER